MYRMHVAAVKVIANAIRVDASVVKCHEWIDLWKMAEIGASELQ